MILVVCGFARAGKTTAVNHLRDRGWLVLSSSQVMHALTQDLFELFGLAVDTTDKEAMIESFVHQAGGDSATQVIETRDFMAGLAEEVLARNLGRRAIVQKLARQAIVVHSRHGRDVVLEVYNQEEYDCLLAEGVPVHFSVAIRSQRERPDLDHRDLIRDSVDLHNDGSVAELKARLDRLLMDLAK